MKTIQFFCLILFFFLTLNVNAQTFKEFEKEEQAKMKQMAGEQKEAMTQLQKEYTDYVKAHDNEFTEYLRQEWENYSVFTGKKLPQKPKPLVMPTYTPPAKPVVTTPSKDVAPKTIPTIMPVITSQTVIPRLLPQLVDPIRKPATDESNASTVKLPFYGRSFTISYDAAMAKCNLQGVSQKSISSFWEKASATNYTPAVERLLQAKFDLNINDFGYFLLVQQFAKELYPASENSARLMSWFIMVRSGYGTRVAYQDSEIALLVPSLQQIYQMSYLNINGINYYVFPRMKGSSYFTYDKDYLTAGRPLDLDISSPINFSGKKAEKTLSFSFENNPYNFTIDYDPDLINFYKNYPLSDFSVYFNSAVSVQAKESLAATLKPLMANMDEVKAVNFILHFVQTAFAYKTDPEQFGREKFFFAEELLFYPYSDCEDRSVLFSYLVREIIGLKTIGLEYPEHMATAVAFNSPQTGDNLIYKNSQYIIADPTFINAPVGMTMPQYQTVSPIVYEINNHTSEDFSTEKIWQLAENSGCYKGSNQRNSKILPDGNTILVGYFSKPVQLGSVSLSGVANTHNCFVSKMNKIGQAIWAKEISATDNAVGMSVETSLLGNLIVAGVFTGSIRFSGKSITAAEGKSDLFLACFSPEGDLIWLNRGDIGSLPQNTSTAFSVAFDANGAKRETRHSGQLLEDRSQGLFVDAKGGIFYSGMTNNTLAIAGNNKPLAFASETTFDVTDLLRTESEKFVAQQADQAIAGLLAAIRLVKFMGVSLTGAQTQQALDKHNPNFKETSPNIYKSLGRINFVQNTKGIVNIQTANGKDISFDKVSISNNSTISISDLPGGNFKIDVLSGIKVGKMVVWYNLNFIKMITKNGDLVFDYDTDHSQSIVNIKKDILN